MDLVELEKTVKLSIEKKYKSNSLHDCLVIFSTKNDIDYVFIELIDNYLLSNEDLKYLICNLQTLSTYIVIIEKIIMENTKVSFSVILERILQIFDKTLNQEDINYLINYTEDCEYNFNLKLENIKLYLQFYGASKIYAKIPSWVSLRKGENLSLLETASPGAPLGDIYQGEKTKNILEETSTLIKKVTLNSNFKNKTLVPDIQKAITSFLSTLSKSEGADVLDEPNRIFGPANAMSDRDCYSRLGGPCRMLECSCMESSKNDYYTNCWFTKNCTECNNIIIDKSHAVRYPKENGGWIGCFCSFECMISNRNIDITNEDNDMFRIELLYRNLDTYGIMDRH